MTTSEPSQAAAIPFRRGDQGVEVCLIRRKGTAHWSIPKGSIESGDSEGDTARKETFEEAGLVGRIVGGRLGTYEYTKGGKPLTVAVYLLEVTSLERRWKEADVRERKWFPPADALALLKGHPGAEVLARGIGRLEEMT